jgi:hypothetical protein
MRFLQVFVIVGCFYSSCAERFFRWLMLRHFKRNLHKSLQLNICRFHKDFMSRACEKAYKTYICDESEKVKLDWHGNCFCVFKIRSLLLFVAEFL